MTGPALKGIDLDAIPAQGCRATVCAWRLCADISAACGGETPSSAGVDASRAHSQLAELPLRRLRTLPTAAWSEASRSSNAAADAGNIREDLERDTVAAGRTGYECPADRRDLPVLGRV